MYWNFRRTVTRLLYVLAALGVIYLIVFQQVTIHQPYLECWGIPPAACVLMVLVFPLFLSLWYPRFAFSFFILLSSQCYHFIYGIFQGKNTYYYNDILNLAATALDKEPERIPGWLSQATHWMAAHPGLCLALGIAVGATITIVIVLVTGANSPSSDIQQINSKLEQQALVLAEVRAETQQTTAEACQVQDELKTRLRECQENLNNLTVDVTNQGKQLLTLESAIPSSITKAQLEVEESLVKHVNNLNEIAEEGINESLKILRESISSQLDEGAAAFDAKIEWQNNKFHNLEQLLQNLQKAIKRGN